MQEDMAKLLQSLREEFPQCPLEELKPFLEESSEISYEEMVKVLARLKDHINQVSEFVKQMERYLLEYRLETLTG